MRVSSLGDALAAGNRSSSTRSASSIRVECLYATSSAYVMLESSSSMRAERCGLSPIGLVARSAGYWSKRTCGGNVAHHGGSFAFCTQPLGGSTVFGMSSKGCNCVHSVADVSPRTIPDQNARSATGRTGLFPP